MKLLNNPLVRARILPQSSASISSRFRCLYATPRSLHITSSSNATVNSLDVPGVPPPPPSAPETPTEIAIARRKKQAELLRKSQDMKAISSGQGAGSAKTKRFWKDVHVKEVNGAFEIHLDTRALRTPTKEAMRIPINKPHLATAVALEWDLLVSAQDALRHHLIPMTSLVSRGLDIVAEDAHIAKQSSAEVGEEAAIGATRKSIVDMVMRYLETDSLICWADEPPADPPGYERHVNRTESLRSIQKREAGAVINYLTERIWPGIDILPVLEEGSIMPRAQPEATTATIERWVRGLPGLELAGLERAVLAGKSLLGAARLVVEWSPHFKGARLDGNAKRSFGVDEAERVASLEVTYQTDMWGMVEDSHDVQKEDLRRQLGSVIILVSAVEP